MTALEDRRPVAALTTASDNPSVIGEDLAHLLVENPDIELASVRLIPNADGTVGIAGRIGELAGVECPQCHQAAGRPHTEYCTLQLREEIFAASSPSRIDQVIQDQHQQALGQTSQPPTLTSGPATFSREHWADLAEMPYPPTHPKGQHGLDQARPVDDLVGHLRDAVARAKQARAHERDHEVEAKGVTWHQTGPDEAHERWRCDPAKCGWETGPKLVCRRCNGYGLLGVVAGVNPVPCPDCAQ